MSTIRVEAMAHIENNKELSAIEMGFQEAYCNVEWNEMKPI